MVMFSNLNVLDDFFEAGQIAGTEYLVYCYPLQFKYERII